MHVAEEGSYDRFDSSSRAPAQERDATRLPPLQTQDSQVAQEAGASGTVHSEAGASEREETVHSEAGASEREGTKSQIETLSATRRAGIG